MEEYVIPDLQTEAQKLDAKFQDLSSQLQSLGDLKLPDLPSLDSNYAPRDFNIENIFGTTSTNPNNNNTPKDLGLDLSKSLSEFNANDNSAKPLYTYSPDTDQYNKGRYSPFVNMEYILHDEQGVSGRLANRISNGFATAWYVTKASGLTTWDALSNLDASKMLDNDYLREADSLIKNLQKESPLYHSKSYQEDPTSVANLLSLEGAFGSGIESLIGFTGGAVGSLVLHEIGAAVVGAAVGSVAGPASSVLGAIGGSAAGLIRTPAILKNIYNTITSARNISNAATTANTIQSGLRTANIVNNVKTYAGAAMRTALSLNGEASLEGLSARENVYNKLYDKQVKAGKLDVLKAEELSNSAQLAVYGANLAVLSASNLLGPLGNFIKGTKLSKKLFKPSLVSTVENGVLTFAPKDSLRRTLLTTGLAYGVKSIPDSVEEGLQFGFSQGFEDYYTQLSGDKETKTMVDRIYDGIKKGFRSNEGIEGVVAGFLSGASTSSIVYTYNELINHETYNRNKEAADILTSTFANLSNNIEKAKKINTLKKIVQNENISSVAADLLGIDEIGHMVDAAVKTNTYDRFIQELQDLKNLNIQDLNNMLNPKVLDEQGQIDNFVESNFKDLTKEEAVGIIDKLITTAENTKKNHEQIRTYLEGTILNTRVTDKMLKVFGLSGLIGDKEEKAMRKAFEERVISVISFTYNRYQGLNNEETEIDDKITRILNLRPTIPGFPVLTPQTFIDPRQYLKDLDLQIQVVTGVDTFKEKELKEFKEDLKNSKDTNDLLNKILNKTFEGNRDNWLGIDLLFDNVELRQAIRDKNEINYYKGLFNEELTGLSSATNREKYFEKILQKEVELKKEVDSWLDPQLLNQSVNNQRTQTNINNLNKDCVELENTVPLQWRDAFTFGN